MASHFKIAIIACLVAGAFAPGPLFAPGPSFAQGLLSDDDDNQDDNPSAMQCVVEEFAGAKPITCEAPPGSPDSPCYCPDAGPASGRRVPTEQ
ncbi:hypothetical protein [Methylocapsa palsarum]|uniref:hypothetical protein n=1 Tax=Methylocapsa palsarum TaxID=1612308 RepID=UPI000B812AD4|nr:hypothetical protein [Methylocapsa palsarum]